MPGLPGIGFNELLVVFVVALIVLGPRRLPEVARTLGKVMGDLRRTADELRYGIEREVRMDELKKAVRQVKDEVDEASRPLTARGLAEARAVPSAATEPVASGDEGETGRQDEGPPVRTAAGEGP